MYLVTRGNVVLLRDTDDDGVADKQEELLRLETRTTIRTTPWAASPAMPTARSSSASARTTATPYRLIGADGTEIKARRRPGRLLPHDGRRQEHRSDSPAACGTRSACAFVPDGRIFAVDNDPDASPPCRLLHVVPGGDYGYLYQYGRAGTHPLQAWNGELPGTLPMVCGTGEAPTAIVPHAGGLWVTSWGDHRIERYELVPRGASYGAKREIIVQGDADFRPTGMAVAPDGSLYFADWVLRDYPVHGRGRIWRLVAAAGRMRKQPFPPRSQEDLAASDDAGDPLKNAELARPVRPRARRLATCPHGQANRLDRRANDSRRLRLSAFEAARLHRTRRCQTAPPQRPHRRFARRAPVRRPLDRRRADRRRSATTWPNCSTGRNPTPSFTWPCSAPSIGSTTNLSMRSTDFTDELLVRELSNDQRSPAAHALALSLLKPYNKFLTTERLEGYLQSKHQPLRLEAVRTLAAANGRQAIRIVGSRRPR